jgi:uncharacterized membrane protein
MTLLFAFLNWTLRRVALAYACCSGRVGRVSGLAQTCAATVSHRLAACRNNSESVSHHGIIFDKLPNTPNRTAPPGLIARIVTGGLTGACVSLGGGPSALLVPGWEWSAESSVVSPAIMLALGS